jgi:hypothetical protein
VRCVRPQGAVTEPGVASPARRLHPKAGPVIVRAADRTRLHTPRLFGHEDSHPTAGLPVLARRVGLRRVARPRPIPQSTSMPKLFSLRYSDERAIPRVAAACTRFPPASRSARTIASRSIDSSALSVLPEVW